MPYICLGWNCKHITIFRNLLAQWPCWSFTLLRQYFEIFVWSFNKPTTTVSIMHWVWGTGRWQWVQWIIQFISAILISLYSSTIFCLFPSLCVLNPFVYWPMMKFLNHTIFRILLALCIAMLIFCNSEAIFWMEWIFTMFSYLSRHTLLSRVTYYTFGGIFLLSSCWF